MLKTVCTVTDRSGVGPGISCESIVAFGASANETFGNKVHTTLTPGNGARRRMAAVFGERADRLSDAERADSIYYTLSPNLHPWGAHNPIAYRFRPYGDRHDMAIMECMYLDPYDPARPR